MPPRRARGSRPIPGSPKPPCSSSIPAACRSRITERDAFALWQRDGKVEVIADDGTVRRALCRRSRFAKLPLVVGAGAETRAKDFLALLDQYPAIRDQLQAAVLVAERRWNLTLNNGIDVRLPEADVEQALDLLVKLDRDDKMSDAATSPRSICGCRIASPCSFPTRPPRRAPRRSRARPPKKKGGAA